LHAAHKAGVIHRDLKPSNILLQPDEETGEVAKIIDFGLAKTAAAATAAPLTRAGQIVGTPQYMAPEQIARKEVDARTDVYALGSVLYAMLCGRPPFMDNNDDVQLLYKQVHEPVEPVRVHAPDVSAELEAVVMRALAKSPRDRFQSAAELARALVPAVEKRAARKPPSEVTEVIEKPHEPRSRAFWLAAATALLLLGAAGGAALMRLSPSGALLMVSSQPPGAAVLVDGKPLADRTPAALQGVAAGEHTITLRHDGFNDLERVVRIERGGRQLVDVHLTPRTRSIELTTVPAGATVFLDGGLVAGKTPLSFDFVEGEYHVMRIEKAGYRTVTKKLMPDDINSPAPIVLDAETQPRGTVFVDAAAPSEVWIDGQYSGFFTPTPGLILAAGDHMVQLRDDHGVLDEVRVHVTKGETTRLSMQLRGKK
jgi:hypothetical protein